MARATLLKGHGLRHEGAAFIAAELRAHGNPSGPGMGKCGCGALSGVLPNRSARQRWHREHKAEIRRMQGG